MVQRTSITYVYFLLFFYIYFFIYEKSIATITAAILLRKGKMQTRIS